MLNNISINSEKVNNGVWRQLLKSKFLVASVNCEKFKQAILDHGSKELSDRDLVSIMAKTILLDWCDVKDPDGNNLLYSEQMAIIALSTSDAVRSFVDSVSTNIGFYCE